MHMHIFYVVVFVFFLLTLWLFYFFFKQKLASIQISAQPSKIHSCFDVIFISCSSSCMLAHNVHKCISGISCIIQNGVKLEIHYLHTPCSWITSQSQVQAGSASLKPRWSSQCLQLWIQSCHYVQDIITNTWGEVRGNGNIYSEARKDTTGHTCLLAAHVPYHFSLSERCPHIVWALLSYLSQHMLRGHIGEIGSLQQQTQEDTAG